jgi:phage baseplate assembly protein gpV
VIDRSDPVAAAFAPQSAQNREQPVHGLVTAVVQKIEDDGTYRLKFLGMNGQDEDNLSAPARVMMPGAGAKRGLHFFPEPGDEVVVAFHVGDTNVPIILGGVWNRDAAPPDQAKQSASNDVRTLVTRSGHELTFDDTPGAEKVTVRSKRGHSVVLDDAPASPRVTLSTSLGKRVVLDDTPPGQISIETAACRISLTDAGAVSIQASASINLSAPVITLAGAAVSIGGGAGSAMIDGVPFRLHTHTGGTLTGGFTGPVGP